MKERLRYFDILKGLAIFMVVMGHVMAMGVRGIDATPLFKFIGQIHMPIFFFISGWLAWRPKAPTLLPKARRLLVPMVAVSTLWIYYYPFSGLQSPFDSTWAGLWTATFKNGYWFTFVLFELFVLYVPVWHLLQRCRSLATSLAVVVASWAVVLAVYYFLPSEACDILSWSLTAEFFAVFMAGVLASRYRDGFLRLTANGNLVGAAIILAGICLELAAWPWRHGIEAEWIQLGLRVVLQLCVALVGIAVVRPWSHSAFAAGRRAPLASMWEYIGSRSLSIYLLHYFFIFPLGTLRDSLVSMDLAFVPMFIFSAAGAAAIVAVVLGVDYILRYAGPLYFLLTGSESLKQTTVKK